eukprot:m.164463 g.164463  ORF g.164463 m.164463 type:complete len:131 (-) comp13424_c0_seq4:4126-4518(-)
MAPYLWCQQQNIHTKLNQNSILSLICFSELVGISANSTAKRKLFSCWRMFYMERTVVTFELFQNRSSGTLGQLVLGAIPTTLVVIVTSIAKVSGPKTEIHGHTAAVSTLELQKVFTMLATNLLSGMATHT